MQFNVLSLDPHDAETIPPELLDALEEVLTIEPGRGATTTLLGDKETEAQKLKRQMQLDALQPLGPYEPGNEDEAIPLSLKKSAEADRIFSEEEIQSAREFLSLKVSVPALSRRRRIVRNRNLCSLLFG